MTTAMPRHTRDKAVNFRLNERELDIINRGANAQQIRVSEFCRLAAIEVARRAIIEG